MMVLIACPKCHVAACRTKEVQKLENALEEVKATAAEAHRRAEEAEQNAQVKNCTLRKTSERFGLKSDIN